MTPTRPGSPAARGVGYAINLDVVPELGREGDRNHAPVNAASPCSDREPVRFKGGDGSPDLRDRLCAAVADMHWSYVSRWSSGASVAALSHLVFTAASTPHDCVGT